jgi:hypothetical protein
MKTRLAEALSRYYCRKHHRIIFRNGKSLNGISLDLWERLDFHGMDKSVLSKVLHGSRLFTPAQIEAFADYLHLTPAERNTLHMSAYLDHLDRAKSRTINTISANQVNFKIGNQLRLVYLFTNLYKRVASLVMRIEVTNASRQVIQWVLHFLAFFHR